MKTFSFSVYKIYFFLLALFINPGFGFSQWTWLNPLPQGNSLMAIQFVNSTTGYATGDGGTVLKTTDAGSTWNRLNTEVLFDLKGLFFLNADTGWVVGVNVPAANGIIMKTTDGGISV